MAKQTPIQEIILPKPPPKKVQYINNIPQQNVQEVEQESVIVAEDKNNIQELSVTDTPQLPIFKEKQKTIKDNNALVEETICKIVNQLSSNTELFNTLATAIANKLENKLTVTQKYNFINLNSTEKVDSRLITFKENLSAYCTLLNKLFADSLETNTYNLLTMESSWRSPHA